MQPYAWKIYDMVFPGCEMQDLREDGLKVHILDKEFGIDTISNFSSGQWVSIQEKYRKYYFLKNFGDFTQEYKNADGTEHEKPGEWFHLGAQIYFYGWANDSETGFAKWFIMDIAKYKLLIESRGGIKNIGTKRFNLKHGRASFYSIPIKEIECCFITDYRDYI